MIGANLVMKLKIIHLSDIHLKTSHENRLDIESFAKAIAHVINENSEDKTKIVIIFTGDLTARGRKGEIFLFKKFIGLLLDNCNLYVSLYFIPGNHDIEMIKELREIRFEQISDSFNKGTQDELVKIYTNQMDNFFNYANNKKLFKNDKFVDCKKFNIDKYTVKIVLINTAMFSTLSHNDKELHYIPEKSLHSIFRDENDDLVLVAMHHSYNWFHESEKTYIENKIKNIAEVLLIGHEHEDRSCETIENEKHLIISKAGELNLSKFKGNFNALTFDLESKKYSIDEYSFDDQTRHFLKIHSTDYKKYYKKTILQVKSKFLDDLMTDTTLAKGNIADYFVFPILTLQTSDNSEKRIDNYNDFEVELKKKKLIIIQALNINGKTTFLKNIFFKAKEDGKLPLFVKPKASEKNMDTILQRCVKEQYEGKNPFDLYKQCNKKEKILLIDDFHLFKFDDKESVLQKLQKEFDYIVIAEKSNESIDVTSSFKEEYIDNFSVFKLGSFVYTKRHELVNRIGAKCGITDQTIICDINQRLDNAFTNLDYVAGANIDFLVHYIHYLFTSENSLDQSFGNNFNTVFEYEINYQIIRYAGKNSLEISRECLKRLAMYLHQNKKSKVKESEFHEILENYGNDFGISFNVNDTKENLKRAKILSSEGDNYISFSNKCYLAYFVAKEISERLNSGNSELFEKALNNICFGINGDIIMFTIYLTSNKNIVNDIENHLEEDTKDYTALSLSHLNIPYLSLSNIDVKKLNTDKEKYSKSRNKSEELKTEDTNLECKDIYDYNEEERSKPSNLLMSNFKYLRIYAQIISTFYTKFDLSEKISMLKKLRLYTRRVVYEILHPLIDIHDDFIKESARLLTEDGKHSYEDNYKYIKESLDVFTIIVILGIYNNIAENCANAQLKIAFKDVFSNDPKNAEICNMIFDVMIIEKLNNEKEFINLIHSYWTEQKNYFFVYMIIIIINKHLLERNLNYKEVQKLVDMVEKDTGFIIYREYMNNKMKRTNAIAIQSNK